MEYRALGRTGIRVSPGSGLGDIVEEDVEELYSALVSALAPLDLAYLHVASNDVNRHHGPHEGDGVHVRRRHFAFFSASTTA